jgi:hypothetical protein
VPPATAVTADGNVTATGVNEFAVPLPSAPLVPLPQHRSAPLEMIAHV